MRKKQNALSKNDYEVLVIKLNLSGNQRSKP